MGMLALLLSVALGQTPSTAPDDRVVALEAQVNRMEQDLAVTRAEATRAAETAAAAQERIAAMDRARNDELGSRQRRAQAMAEAVAALPGIEDSLRSGSDEIGLPLEAVRSRLALAHDEAVRMGATREAAPLAAAEQALALMRDRLAQSDFTGARTALVDTAAWVVTAQARSAP